ncbi:hypothetical protein KA005_46355, partial [bacterium]|nr:hypothetical protein [bacterium]
MSTAIDHCGRAIAAMLPGFGLASFWIAPFLYVSSLANREGVLLEFNQIRNLDLISVIGLKEPPPTSIWGPTTFASPVLIMAAVGFLLSLKRRDVILSLAIITVTFAILTAVPNILIVNVFKSVWAKINVRGIIPTMIFLPVIAGYGAIGLSQQIVNFLYLLIRNRKVGESGSEQRLIPWSILKSGVAGLLGIAIAICTFLYLRHAPPGYGSYQGYGLQRSDAWWPFKFENGRVMINHWPTFMMSSDDWPN